MVYGSSEKNGVEVEGRKISQQKNGSGCNKTNPLINNVSIRRNFENKQRIVVKNRSIVKETLKISGHEN